MQEILIDCDFLILFMFVYRSGAYLMIIDLTHPVYTGMPVFPGDPETVIIQTAGYDRDGYLVHSLAMCSHTGTHLDAPRHYRPSGVSVESYSVLEKCIGPAHVLDATGIAAGEEITPPDLDASFSPGERILIATGWSERFGRDDYFTRYPSISEELAALFVERKITLLGVETPSLHLTKCDAIHTLLLAAGIIVVENLANLRQLVGKYVFFSAAPLKLQGIDGSPVRAYAVM